MGADHPKARKWTGLTARIRQFLAAREGASAVEFAFLAPVLLSIYISAFEITNGYTAAGKILKATASISDIVARQPHVDRAFLSEMIDAAEATIAPHSTDGLELKISGVTIDSAGNAKVLWSWDQDGNAPYARGAAVSVPEDLRAPSSFLVHSEISVPHELLLFLSAGATGSKSLKTITIRREFFYRQRLGDDVPCTDCG